MGPGLWAGAVAGVGASGMSLENWAAQQGRAAEAGPGGSGDPPVGVHGAVGGEQGKGVPEEKEDGGWPYPSGPSLPIRQFCLGVLGAPPSSVPQDLWVQCYPFAVTPACQS